MHLRCISAVKDSSLVIDGRHTAHFTSLKQLFVLRRTGERWSIPPSPPPSKEWIRRVGRSHRRRHRRCQRRRRQRRRRQFPLLRGSDTAGMSPPGSPLHNRMRGATEAEAEAAERRPNRAPSRERKPERRRVEPPPRRCPALPPAATKDRSRGRVTRRATDSNAASRGPRAITGTSSRRYSTWG